MPEPIRVGAVNYLNTKPLIHDLEIGHPDIDWVLLAKGMGVPGRRVTSLEGFAAALKEGFDSDGPMLIEVGL